MSAPPTLPDAAPLTGTERCAVVQGSRMRGLGLGILRDWLMGLVQGAIGAALAPILARVAALEAADAAQVARDAAQDAALSQEAAGRQAADAAEALARQAVAAALAAETARVAALEARPEEAAHFTASAKMPAITVVQPVTLMLTGLVPAVAGDRIRKGEAVLVEPAAGLPQGVNVAAVYVPADDTVAVQLTTGINLAVGTTPLAWAITALR